MKPNILWVDDSELNLVKLGEEIDAYVSFHPIDWCKYGWPAKDMLHDARRWNTLYPDCDGVIGLFTDYHLQWVPKWWDKPIYNMLHGDPTLVPLDPLPRSTRPAGWFHNGNAPISPMWSCVFQHFTMPCTQVFSNRNMAPDRYAALLVSDPDTIPRKYVDSDLPIYWGRELYAPEESVYPCVWEQIQ